MKTIDDALKHADTFDSPHTQHMSIVMLAAEVRRLRSEIDSAREDLQSFVDDRNHWETKAEAAESALKEAQDQYPAAFWWIGPDGKDNGGPYRGKPSDAAIDNARNMGCEPVLLYARPVPAAPVVAVPAVPEEWREVLRECADDLAIELDQRYGDSRKYPSEQRKYEAEMQPVYRARALLQSTGDKK